MNICFGRGFAAHRGVRGYLATRYREAASGQIVATSDCVLAASGPIVLSTGGTMAIRFTLNGEARSFEGNAEMPVLWYVRDHAQLTGTKYGCGAGLCGACTVLIDGQATRACVLPMQTLEGRSVITVEGLGRNGLHPVQKAWIAEDVAQCGYCQAGQILAAVDLLARVPEPKPEDIDSITNLCRCGTYVRIRRAIERAARELRAQKAET
jgi:isoquinoline 1-oxidoreductase subunit alpha